MALESTIISHESYPQNDKLNGETNYRDNGAVPATIIMDGKYKISLKKRSLERLEKTNCKISPSLAEVFIRVF